MSRKDRTHYSAQQKVAIIRRHLVDQVPVSELCDEYHLQPTVFYRWQKEFFENGAAAFAKAQPKNNTGLENKIALLEKKLATKNEVVAELMEAHIKLKKELGEL